MAAPTPTARQDPAGIKLKNGHKTLVTFSLDPDIEFWEATVTPPAMDGGEPVPQTTMHNDVAHTKAPRTLVDYGDTVINAAWDPIMYTRARQYVNVEQTITVRFPDTSTLAYYGYLRSVTPTELAEGSPPRVNLVVVSTNADPTTGAEELPVLNNIPGT